MNPSLSVVVASNRSPELLDACLSSLDEQCRAHRAEIVVARAGAGASISSVVESHPLVRVVDAPGGASVPLLRGLGLGEASGDAVALTEDHCRADTGWIEALLDGLRTGGDVVGGGMGNARTSRAVDWAAYFSEYGFFSSTRPPDPTDPPLITGANVAYGPRALRDVALWASEGCWEDVIHGRLHRQGASFLFRPEARMLQNKTYETVPFCVDRFEHGFDYARMRLEEQPSSGRWSRVLASLVLPFVLTSRVARSSAREDGWAFLRALPWTLLFLSAWSVGEMAGYWRGPKRTSLDSVTSERQSPAGNPFRE